MPVLHIALLEGFTDDTVIIRVNGGLVFRKDAVRTMVQTGYADSVEVDVTEETANVEIDVQSRDLSDCIVLLSEQATYLGVSLAWDEGISWQISKVPFGDL
jgi:hypothetical protein